MIVSNASPLIYLAKVGKLELLKIFGEVVIPEEVKVEVVDSGRNTAILSLNEIKEVDDIATNLKRFTQTDLRSACGSSKKAMGYIVYAYEKGWIRVVKIGGRGNAVILKEFNYLYFLVIYIHLAGCENLTCTKQNLTKPRFPTKLNDLPNEY
jgi:hypothetical protein